jgi:DNA-binding XRE family transcriptional regulator
MSALNQIKSVFRDQKTSNEPILFLFEGNFWESLSQLESSKRDKLLDLIKFLPPPINSPSFGNWVQRARDELNLTQEELGGVVEVSKSSVTKLEKTNSGIAKKKLPTLRDYLCEHLRNRGAL